VTCRPGTTTPRTVTLRDGPVAVAAVVDEWLIEDEWWRRPLARRYLRLLLADGRLLTLFEDLVHGGWYLQPYHAPSDPHAQQAPASAPRPRREPPTARSRRR
jgi:hypothetical protein